MEERIIKLCASLSMVLMLLVCSSFFYLPQLHIYEEAVRKQYDEEAAIRDRLENMTGLELLHYNNRETQQKEAAEKSFPEQLRIALPEGTNPSLVSVETDYLKRIVTVTIPGADREYLLNYPMVGGPEHISSLTYESTGDTGYLDIETDLVREPMTRTDGRYLYLDLKDPHELYERVVVIDAGHGGKASGAVRKGICEKDLDLAIVQELKDILEELQDPGLRVYYTRLDDSNPTFQDRAELANRSGADLFISVHNNVAAAGRSVTGTTVLYDEEKTGKEGGSRHLAELCSEEVCGSTGNVSLGLMDGNDIYILRTAGMPAALVEVGFMSDETELRNLQNPVYQRKAAQGIVNAIYRAFREGCD